MKRRRILLIITLLIFVLSFTYNYLWEQSASEIDWLMVTLIPVIFLFIPALILGLLIKVIYKKENIYNIFIITFSLGLAVAIYYNVGYFLGIYHPDYVAMNKDSNDFYKNYYANSKDSLITLALTALDKKPQSKGYGIESIEFVERDTVVKNDSLKYYDVQIKYFIGEKMSDKNAFECRYLIYSDKTVQEVYNKRLNYNATTNQ